MSGVGDVVGGRYELTELVAVMDADGRWRCPRCGAETNSYGHHDRPCTAHETAHGAPDA